MRENGKKETERERVSNTNRVRQRESNTNRVCVRERAIGIG